MPRIIVEHRARGSRLVKRFGHQRQQRDAEQRADRVANQPRHQLDAERVTEQQEDRGGEQSAEAAENAQPHGDRIHTHEES